MQRFQLTARRWRERVESAMPSAELRGGGAGRDRDAREADRERAPQVADRATVKLARASLTDAHTRAGLTEGEGVAVIAGQNLALADRERPERTLDATAKVLALELVVQPVVGREEWPPLVLDEAVQGHRTRALVGGRAAAALVHAPQLVDDGAADAEAGVRLERHTSAGFESVDGVYQPEQCRGGDVIGVGDGIRNDPDAPGKRVRERDVPLDQRGARPRVARATTRPELGSLQ